MKKIIYIITAVLIGFIFLAFIFLYVFKNYGTSLESIKNGQNLNKATKVGIEHYFEKFYENSISSSFDNNWYVLYQDDSFIYYAQKCIKNDKLACYFSKIGKNELNESLPVYKISNSLNLYHKALSDYIEANKKEYFNFDNCKAIGGYNGRNYKLDKNLIIVSGSIENTCEKKDGSGIESKVQTYTLSLSTNDFTIIESKWNYPE